MRRTIIAFGFLVCGIFLFVMSFAAYEGAAFIPAASGSRFGPPRAWSAIQIDTSSNQIVAAIILAAIGAGCIWYSYKNFKHRMEEE